MNFDWFVLGMRMQVILDSSFARPGSAPIRGVKKGEFRDWTKGIREPHEAKKKSFDLGGNRTESGGPGFDSHRGQKIFSLPRVVP